MFPLRTSQLPPDAAALRDALEASIGEVVRTPHPVVMIEEKSYPELAALHLNLDNARAGDRRPPALRRPSGKTEPGLRVDDFAIHAQPLFIRDAPVQLSCQAREVEISQGRDSSGNLLLLLQDAAAGTVEISLRLADLEALLLEGAKVAAAKQGVTVESVTVQLRSESERALALEVNVRAKKLFLSASVRISGRLEIDPELKAALSQLRCTGEGALGSLACGFLAPQLERFEGQKVSLLALPLGEVKLRDVRITSGLSLRVTAEFGHAAA